MFNGKLLIVRKDILPQLQKKTTNKLLTYKKTPNPNSKKDLDDFIFGNDNYQKHSER